MSWLNGMVDEGEVASQDQRLDRTTDRLAPGFFTGALSTVGPGLLRGGIEAARTAQTTALQLGSAAIESDLSIGAGYFPEFEDGQILLRSVSSGRSWARLPPSCRARWLALWPLDRWVRLPLLAHLQAMPVSRWRWPRASTKPPPPSRA